MCAGKATLLKELFFKDSVHPVLVGGSEGGLILKNKVWMQAAERTFLLLQAAAHTQHRLGGDSALAGKTQKNHICLRTNSRLHLQRSMPGWEMGCQSRVNRSLLRKTQGLHLKKNHHRGRGAAPALPSEIPTGDSPHCRGRAQPQDRIHPSGLGLTLSRLQVW